MKQFFYFITYILIVFCFGCSQMNNYIGALKTCINVVNPMYYWGASEKSDEKEKKQSKATTNNDQKKLTPEEIFSTFVEGNKLFSNNKNNRNQFSKEIKK
ncbi:hypothetical protein MHK_000664 [Candidatus Magnetomorum sp. HK-1]|nr:hypothetical protein MHK_000664 [Candidatus Magnetomorum sp. HK-1]